MGLYEDNLKKLRGETEEETKNRKEEEQDDIFSSNLKELNKRTEKQSTSGKNYSDSSDPISARDDAFEQLLKDRERRQAIVASFGDVAVPQKQKVEEAPEEETTSQSRYSSAVTDDIIKAVEEAQQRYASASPEASVRGMSEADKKKQQEANQAAQEWYKNQEDTLGEMPKDMQDLVSNVVRLSEEVHKNPNEVEQNTAILDEFIPDRDNSSKSAYDQLADEYLRQLETVREYGEETGVDVDEVLRYALKRQDDERVKEEKEEDAKAVDTAPKAATETALHFLKFVPATAASAIDVAGQYLERAVSGSDQPINENSSGQRWQQSEQNKIETISENIQKSVDGSLDTEGPSWGKTLSFLYQTGVSGGESITASFIPGGAAWLGLGAGTRAWATAKEAGASDGKALTSGIANGVFEALFERIGIDELNSLKVKDPDSLKTIVKNFVRIMGKEGLEEGATQIADDLADAFVLGDISSVGGVYNDAFEYYRAQGMTEQEAKKEAFEQAAWYFAQDVGLAFAGGALMGLGMGGVGTTIGYFNNRGTGRQVQQAGNVDSVVQAASETGNPELMALAKEVAGETGGKEASAAKVGSLVNQTAKETAKQYSEKADAAMTGEVKSRLESLGVSEAESGALAAAVSKQAKGERLNRSEKNILKSSAQGQRVASELANAEDPGYDSGWVKAAQESVKESTKSEVQTMNALRNAFRSSGVKVTSEDGTKTAKAVGFVKAESGGVEVKLNDGTTASVSSLQFDDQDTKSLFMAANSLTEKSGASAQTADMFVSGYQGGPVSEYFMDFARAYNIGHSGVDFTAAKNRLADSDLSAAQLETAFYAGKSDGENQTAARQVRLDSLVKSAKEAGVSQKAGSFDESAIKGASLTQQQADSIEVLRGLSQAFGLKIKLTDSSKNGFGKDGRRIGQNGSYDRDTNTIEVDIWAGSVYAQNLETAILNTTAHEMTHYIQNWSPAQYNALKSAVLNGLSKSKSVDDLVLKKQMAYSEAGQDLSYEEALDEVVADACETMLHDSKWVRQLCAENRTLGEKIKQWVDNIIRLLENALKGVTANSEEAKALEASLEDYQKVQDIWISALKSAAQADQAARAAETQERGRTDRAAQEGRQGHTQYQARQNQGKTLKPDMKSNFSTQVDWVIDQANKAADLGKSAKRINDVLLVGRTPKVLVNCGLNPLPVTITANHVKSIYFAKGDDRVPAGMHPHDLGEAIKQLPEKLAHPVMVITSETEPDTSLVVVCDFKDRQGNLVMGAVRVNGENDIHKATHDTNPVTSFYGKKNLPKLIENAFKREAAGKVGVLYVDTKKATMLASAAGMQNPGSHGKNAGHTGAITLASTAGVQFPGNLRKYAGYIHSIRESGSPVKPEFQDAIESRQFKRWFGDWENDPQTASKAVDEHGRPLLLYHQTSRQANFGEFDMTREGSAAFDSDTPAGIYLKTTPEELKLGKGQQKQMEMYANIRQPLEAKDRAALVEQLRKDEQYRGLKDKLGALENRYEKLLEEAESKEDEAYRKAYAEGTLEQLEESDEADRILEEWRKEEETLSRQAHKRAAAYLKSQGYDGVHLLKDEGGTGKGSVETWIAFSANQVKSTDNVGTYSKKENNIFYSLRTVSEPEETALKDHFGVTKNPELAGYMMTDGTMLDFSGKHWGDTSSDMRQVDHRDITELEDMFGDMDGDEAIVAMLSGGEIRLSPESGGINLAKVPTDSQKAALRRYFNHFSGAVSVDIDDADGKTIHSWYYDEGTSSTRILSDLEKYFSDGVVPEIKHRQFSLRIGQKLTYENLISKEDMVLTQVDTKPDFKADKAGRKALIEKAIQNAERVGRKNEAGNVFVYVKDMDGEILVGKDGLRHGIDRRFLEIAPVTLKAGEILKNAILINELTPKKAQAEHSYVLLGAAKNESGDAFIVEFVVNRYTNELSSLDVLYSLNTKKGTAVLNAPAVTGHPAPHYGSRKGTAVLNAPGFRDFSPALNGSTISIAQLLEMARENFPDVLPESVLREFGYTERPSGEKGSSALYQIRQGGSQLEAENARLRRQVELLKEEFKLTNGHKMNKNAVNVLAGRLLRQYSSGYDRDLLESRLYEFFNSIANDSESSWFSFMDGATEIMTDVLEQSSRKEPSLRKQDPMYEELYQMLSAPITLRPDEYRSITAAFGKPERGRILGLRVKKGDETTPSLDVLHSTELIERFRGFFSPDQATAEDIFLRMAEARDAVNETTVVNEYGQDMEMASRMAAEALFEDYLNVPEKTTMADKNRAKVMRLRAEFKASRKSALESQKAAYTDRIRKIREELKKQRQKTAQVQKEAERKIDKAYNFGVADQRLADDIYFAGKLARAQSRMQRKYENLKSRKDKVFADYKERRRMTELRGKITRLKDDFSSRVLRPTDGHYVPSYLVRGAIDVAAMLDTVGREYDSHGDPTKASMKHESVRNALLVLKSQYDKMANDPNSDYATEYDPEFSNQIDALAEAIGSKPVRDMSYAQLQDVYSILRDIRNTITDAVKQIRKGEAITNYQMATDVIGQVRTAPLPSNPAKGAAEKVMVGLAMNPLRAARRMAGYKAGGLSTLMDDLAEGMRKKNLFAMNSTKKFDLIRDMDQNAYDDAVKREVEVPILTTEGKNLRLTKMQIMQLVLSWKREQSNENLSHLLRGGFVIPDAKLLGKGLYRDAVAAGQRVSSMTQENYQVLYDMLSDWDKQYMEQASKFFNEDAQRAINETTRVLKHRDVALSKDYIPFSVDQDFVTKEIDGLKYDATLMGRGLLKSTAVNAGQPLVMEGLSNVVNRHIKDVSDIYGLAIPIRNLNKVYNVKLSGNTDSVKKAINARWGKAGTDIIEKLLVDLQTGRKSSDGFFAKGTKWLQDRFVTNALMFNYGVTLKQLSGYWLAGAYIDWPILIKHMADPLRIFGNVNGKYAQDLFNEIDQHTATHWLRRQGMTMREVAERQRIKLPGNADRAMKAALDLGRKTPSALHAVSWIENMDNAATAAMWNAAKEQVSKNGIAKSDDRYWKEVASLFDKIIEETQPMYDPLHRAEIQKANDPASRVLLLFQSQNVQNYGLIMDTWGEWQAARASHDKAKIDAAKRKMVSIVTSQLVSAVAFVAIGAFVRALRHSMNVYRDDETGNVTMEAFLTETGWELLQAVSPMVLPVISDYIVDTAENIIKDQNYSLLEFPPFELVNDVVGDIGNAVNDPDEDSLKTLAMDAAALIGVPAKNMVNTMNGFRLHLDDILNGQFLSFESGYERNGSQRAAQIVDDLLAEDEEAAKEKIDSFIQWKVDGYLEAGKDEDEAEKDAMTSVKTAMTKLFKPMYLDAYKKADSDGKNAVISMMRATGIYENPNDTCEGWVDQYKKDQEE